MTSRQRRTKPLHPTKIPGYVPTSATGMFLFKAKHFFVEPEHVAESYPYDRGVIHPKGWMVPYFEYRGLGAPPSDVGLPGDVWLDGTSQVAALYVNTGHDPAAAWRPFSASDFANRVLVPHPLVPERVLWCTRRGVVWCDCKTTLRHWTAMRKELGLGVGDAGAQQHALEDLLDHILSVDPEEEGFVAAGRPNDEQHNRLQAVSSEPIPTSISVPRSNDQPQKSEDDRADMILEDPQLVANNSTTNTRVLRIPAFAHRSGFSDGSPGFSPAHFNDDPFRTLGSDDQGSRGFHRREALHPALADTQDSRLSTAGTGYRSQAPSLYSATAFDSSPAFDARQLAASVTQPQARAAFVPHPTSPATKFLHRITAEAISRRRRTFPSSIFSRGATQDHVTAAEPPHIRDDMASGLEDDDDPLPSDSSPDGESQTLYSSQDKTAIQSESPDHSQPAPSVPTTERPADSSNPLLAPVENADQATGASESSSDTVSSNTQQPVRPENKTDRAAEQQQAQIQYLLQEVGRLQSEVSFLKENRKLREGNTRAVTEHIGSVTACSGAAPLPPEIQEIVGPAMDSLKHGIVLLAAKYQAERAAHLEVKQRLEEMQNLATQPSSLTEAMDTGLDNQTAEITASQSLSTKPPLIEAIDPRPDDEMAEPVPLSSQPEVDHTAISKLTAPPPPPRIRNRPSGRVPGFAIALRGMKAVRKSSLSSSAAGPSGGNDPAVTRPAKRPRVPSETIMSPKSSEGRGSGNAHQKNALGSGEQSGQAPAASRIGPQHLRILYLSHRGLEYCRSCLVRRRQDSEFCLVSFASNTEVDVLVEHCKAEHPVACEKLVDKSADELSSIREQLESADAQLLDSMDVDEEEE